MGRVERRGGVRRESLLRGVGRCMGGPLRITESVPPQAVCFTARDRGPKGAGHTSFPSSGSECVRPGLLNRCHHKQTLCAVQAFHAGHITLHLESCLLGRLWVTRSYEFHKNPPVRLIDEVPDPSTIRNLVLISPVVPARVGAKREVTLEAIHALAIDCCGLCGEPVPGIRHRVAKLAQSVRPSLAACAVMQTISYSPFFAGRATTSPRFPLPMFRPQDPNPRVLSATWLGRAHPGAPPPRFPDPSPTKARARSPASFRQQPTTPRTAASPRRHVPFE